MSLRNEPEKETVVGILHINESLVNLRRDQGTTLNESLIAAYKELGIKDLYLFDTELGTPHALENDFSRINLISRGDIVKELEKRGFIVHGVVTPADMMLDNPNYPGQAYKKYYAPQYQRLMRFKMPKKGRLTPETLNDDEEFKAASTELTRHSDIRFVADSHSMQGVKMPELTPSATGWMHAYFVTHRPSWVGSIVYADTEVNCNEVAAVSRKNDPSPLITVAISKDAQKGFPKKIEKQDAIKKDYVESIERQGQSKEMAASFSKGKEHFADTERLAALITNIQKLKSDYLTLHRSTHKKDIDALLATILKIQNDKIDVKEKYRQSLIAVENAFANEREHFKKVRFFDFLNKPQRTDQGFIERLKTNTHDYQYPKLLALVLQREEPYRERNSPYRTILTPSLKSMVSSIPVPNHSLHDEKIPALLGKHYDNAYQDLEKQLKEEYQFSPTQIYRYYKEEDAFQGNNVDLSVLIDQLIKLRKSRESDAYQPHVEQREH